MTMRGFRPRRFQAGGLITADVPGQVFGGFSVGANGVLMNNATGQPASQTDITNLVGMGSITAVAANQFNQASTAAPASTAPAATTPAASSSAPSGATYASWTPAQQQAYSNGVPVDQVNAMAAPAAAAPAAAAPSYAYNPYVAPSANPAAPAGYAAVPFGTGTSVVLDPTSLAAQFQAYANSPFMTPAAVQNENIVGNAGLPAGLQGNATVTVNGQQVPWNSMTPEQQYMYSELNATGQAIPSNFMTTYQGPSTAWNSPNLNSLTIPQGSSIVGGALTTPSSGTGGIASPGAFTSSAPGAGVGGNQGAAGVPQASLGNLNAPAGGFMGQSGGLGYARGGAIGERSRSMRIRPRRFQMGGVNPAAGGLPPWLQALQAAQAGGLPTQSPGGGAAGAGAMAGALPPGPGAAAMGAMAGASPGVGGPPQMPGVPHPGAGAAGLGAMAGALPGGPGAAALGAMAGASPGSPMGGAPGAGAPSPNQQWGQMLLAGAPNTGLGNQGGISNPQAMQALYRQYLNRLGTGGFAQGGAVGEMARDGSFGEGDRHGDVGGHYTHPLDAMDHAPGSHPARQWGLIAEPGSRYATGGKVDKAPKRHASGVPMSRRRATGGSVDPAPTRHASGVPMSRADLGPGEPVGRVSQFDSTRSTPSNLPPKAAGKGRGFARGGRTFDSTKPAPDNLATSAAGKKFARGGKSVLRRRMRAKSEPPPTPPPQREDLQTAGQLTPDQTPPPIAPAAPPTPGPAAPFAKGGKWIAGAIKHPGALRAKLGVKEGENIPASKLAKAERSSNPTTRKQANLAKTLKGFRHAEGGALKFQAGGAFEAAPVKRGAVRSGEAGQTGETIPPKRGAVGPIHEELRRRKDAMLARGGKLCERCGKAHGGKCAMARGGAVCASCGKRHGGECKMAAGGAAKQRRGFPHTIPPPKPQKLASGGTVRGGGAAQRGLRFSGIY